MAKKTIDKQKKTKTKKVKKAKGTKFDKLVSKGKKQGYYYRLWFTLVVHKERGVHSAHYPA